jgi:hypothetical protein
VHLNVLWSFHAQGRWSQPDDPRVVFASERMIHKLYVVREARSADAPAEDSSYLEFVRHDLLPELEKTLFPQG